MEHLKDPGVILGGIDLIAIGVVYAHLQRQITVIKEKHGKIENLDEVQKNIDILNKNIKALNNQNVVLAKHIDNLSVRLDFLEDKKVIAKGDKISKKKPSKKIESSDEDEPEQTDEELVISMAKKKSKNKSPN